MAKKKESYWNYRLYKKEYITARDQKYIECGIIEVYYKNNKIEGYTDNFMYPWGETPEEAKKDLELMKKAFDLPVLTLEDLEPKKTAKKKAKKKNEKSKR